MTVKLYVGRDFQNIIHEPQYEHEFTGIRAICTYLWETFHQQEKAFAVIANAQMTGAGRELSPDLVVISEEGMGVVELKQSSGLIDCSEANGEWTAGGKPINAGGQANPHKQAQDYMAQIRDDLTGSQTWLPGNEGAQANFKFHTAVCFPNPQADIDWCQKLLKEEYRSRPKLKAWEKKLSVLKPKQVPNWAAGLRFEVSQGHANFFRTYRLTPAAITNLATGFFNAVEWKIMTTLMPLGAAYACLALGDDMLPPYRLTSDCIIIGRNWSCDLVLPGQYKRASNRHARIIRDAAGVFIEDLDSLNGTFINKKPLRNREKLESGQVITLGGKSGANTKVCQLRYTHVKDMDSGDMEEIDGLIKTEEATSLGLNVE
ncbi:MAG: FHA domain-containing protein [Chloroflexi bacterium]|nr:FHA domain-containing protein [Chloroflexota bacterium]